MVQFLWQDVSIATSPHSVPSCRAAKAEVDRKTSRGGTFWRRKAGADCLSLTRAPLNGGGSFCSVLVEVIFLFASLTSLVPMQIF